MINFDEMTPDQRRLYGFTPITPATINQLEWQYQAWTERERKRTERERKARLWATSKRLLEMYNRR